MRLLKLAFLCVLAAAILRGPQAMASETMATVTASSLKVRSAPGPDAASIGSLVSGTFVMVQEVQGQWALVHWFKNEKLTSGWVAAQYLKPVPPRGLSGGAYSTPEGAQFDLSVDSADLNCREGYDSGFSRCEVIINVSYDSDYNGGDDPSVFVNCDATLSLTDVKSSSSSKFLNNNQYFYGRSSAGTIFLSSSFYSVDPIVEVRIRDVACQIMHVF